MSLLLDFRRFSLLPGFIQTGNDEPRKAHFLGRKNATPLDRQQDTGGKNEQPPRKPLAGKYRNLADLTLGDVEAAITFFRPQLVVPPKTDWLAKNYFCVLPLKRNLDERPPVVFGRVTSCYPASGELENIETLEMHFPHPNAAPDLLHVYKEDVNPRRPIESYCVGVKAYLSEKEIQDFSRSENIFIEKGFAPLYEPGYGELLHVAEQHRAELPWLYVFGSEWFATIPDERQPEVKQQIQQLMRWNRVVLNYHPRKYLLQYRSLNDELEFNYGFTDQYLFSPYDTNQVLLKVNELFDAMFMQGIS